MTAASADRNTPRSTGNTTRIPVAASTLIYGNTLLAYDATGYAEPATDAAAILFAGVAVKQVDNSSGADGDEVVESFQRGQFQFTFSGAATQADVGKKIYAVDDSTVALAATTINDLHCGTIKEVLSATEIIGSIDEAAQAGA